MIANSADSLTFARAFQLERDMMPALATLLPSALGLADVTTERMALRQTPTVGNVIPDFLIGVWSTAPLKSARITYIEAAVLVAARSLGAFTQDDLLKDVLLSTAIAKRSIDRLVTAGHLRFESDRFHFLASPSFSDIEIIAIEVKLRRWKEALAQAIQYQKFSDRSYVVLDERQFRGREEIIDQFVTAGVGLMLQSDGAVTNLCPAETRTFHCTERILAVQQLLHAIDATRYGC